MASVSVSEEITATVFDGQPLPVQPQTAAGGGGRPECSPGPHHQASSRNHASKGQFIEADGEIGPQLIPTPSARSGDPES